MLKCFVVDVVVVEKVSFSKLVWMKYVESVDILEKIIFIKILHKFKHEINRNFKYDMN